MFRKLFTIFLVGLFSFGVIGCSYLSTTQPKNVTQKLLVVDRQFTSVARTAKVYLKSLEKPLTKKQKERVRKIQELVNKGDKILDSAWVIHSEYQEGKAKKNELIGKIKTASSIIKELNDLRSEF